MVNDGDSPLVALGVALRAGIVLREHLAWHKAEPGTYEMLIKLKYVAAEEAYVQYIEVVEVAAK